MTRGRFVRGAASVVLAGALLVGTAGCTFFSTQATLIPYSPSDGVGLEVGSVKVLNALALPSKDGQAVSLLITLVNNGDSNARVNLQYEVDGEKRTVTKVVEPRRSVSFGNTVDEDQIVLMGTGVGPGELLPVYVQYGKESGKTMMVPVLDPSLPEYEDLRAPEILR